MASLLGPLAATELLNLIDYEGIPFSMAIPVVLLVAALVALASVLRLAGKKILKTHPGPDRRANRSP